MKKPLIALALLALTLPFGCKAQDTPPDPLATRGGFCDGWAKAACQQVVLDDCSAASAGACEAKQSAICLKKAPTVYDSLHASECLDAVTAAYADGDLSADELAIVLSFGAPCDQLSKGTSSDGEACVENNNCDTAAGSTCIKKLGATNGTCGKPVVMKGGEACDGAAQVCADGNFCNAANCVVYKKTGAACDGDYQCSPENHCVMAAAATMGTCEAREALNATCTSNEDCQSHYCAVNTDPTKSKCASKIRLSLNEPLCDDLR
jgi:hypothetical protein